MQMESQSFLTPAVHVFHTKFHVYFEPPVSTGELMTEKYMNEFDDECVDGVPFPTENAGSFGRGRLVFSLNIRITDDMVGLSSTSSWTHSRAMCIHLTTSCVTHDSEMEGSINSKNRSSFHSSQAYT